MIKLAATILALAGLAVPFAHAAKAPATASVEQKLLRQVNSGPDGKITRRVSCRAVGERRFACSLQGLARTAPARVSAEVSLRGGSVVTAFGPLQG